MKENGNRLLGKEKILLIILFVLILLFSVIIFAYCKINNSIDLEDDSNDIQLEDSYMYQGLLLYNVSFDNEDNKTKISLTAKNTLTSSFTLKQIQVNLYNKENETIGFIILNLVDDIGASQEVELSQEVEPAFENVYSISFEDKDEFSDWEDMDSEEAQMDVESEYSGDDNNQEE